MMSIARKKLLAMAVRYSRLTAEANIPMARDRKNVFTKSSTIRQNSPLATPPANSGMAMMGKIASNA